MRSAVHGLSHGLKTARPLSIFAPACALVPPFQVQSSATATKSPTAKAVGLFVLFVYTLDIKSQSSSKRIPQLFTIHYYFLLFKNRLLVFSEE